MRRSSGRVRNRNKLPKGKLSPANKVKNEKRQDHRGWSPIPSSDLK